MAEKQHVFLVGAKSLGAYGGYETFIDKMTEYHQNNEKIQYHVAVKANGQGHMDETKVDAKILSDALFIYHNAECLKIHVPEKLGPAQAIYYDCKALSECVKYIKENKIKHPIVYIMACRIGPFMKKYYKEIHSYIIGLITMRGEFLSSAFQFEMSGGAHVYVELHALAFILGLSFVYMISHRRGNRINKLKAILCAIYFVISWKRIGLFAVVFVFGLNIILKRKNALYKYFANNLIAVAGVVACLIYVSFSASDLLIELLGKYGISMMGRNIIFSYFRQFCDFSPSYLGRGVGFVGKQFTFTTARELYNMASIRALHNDFFKVYLQIGFAGFIAWAFYWLSYIPKFIARKFGVNSGYIALMVIVYSFIIYTTDNMEGNYNYQLVLSMLLTTTCLTAYKKKGMA